MTIPNDESSSSGLPPLNGTADPRWTLYSPPGKGHHNFFTTTLPGIASASTQGSYVSPRRHKPITVNTTNFPELISKEDVKSNPPKYYQSAPRPHDTVPDIKGNRPYEINKARFPLHGFVEEPLEWKTQRKDASNVVQQRVAQQAHFGDATATASHQYPENIEATRILAARRVKKAYINEVRMETSHHFHPVPYTEEEMRQIDLDNMRNALLERKDCQAEMVRQMKVSNPEISDLEGVRVPAPPSCPKPSGGNARARKFRKAKKKSEEHKTMEY